MNENTIILDQVAIWIPKASNGFTIKKSPVGTTYKTKAGVIKQSTGLLVRAAKNYYLGGDAVEDEEVKVKEAVKAFENETNAIDEEGAVDEVEEENEEVVEVPVEEVKEVEASKLKFCLFVRSDRSDSEVERKLDCVAKEITESEVLAAIGRSQTHGFNSFEYTNYNLEDIE